MKTPRLLLLAGLMLISVTSCEESQPVVEIGKPEPVRFEASIEKRQAARAANTAWDINDAIGVYMKTAQGDLTTSTIEGAGNVKYTTIGETSKSFTAAANGIEFPTDGSKVDFIAYYPYKTTIDNYEYAVDVATQTSQPGIDLLYSNNAADLDKTVAGGKVDLAFSHQLSKIIINVTAGNAVPNLNGLVVKVSGTHTKATFALKDGTLTPTGDAADITMKLTSGATAVAEAIILPNATGDRKFLFELDGRTFTYELPATTEFLKGTKYTYDATLAREGVTVLQPEGSITDWNDSPQGSITPTPGDPTPPPVGTRVEFFKELFGDGGDYNGSSKRKLVAAMDNWSMQPPITYADATGKADIRSTATVSPSLWMPSTGPSELVINGVDQLITAEGGFTNIQLSYDLASQASNGSPAHIIVSYSTDGSVYNQLPAPSEAFDGANKFITIPAVPITENNISSLKFSYDPAGGGNGYRLDNVILSGIKP